MTDYKIEHEVEIHAPIEVVWHTITTPDQLTRWFANRAELNAVPGGAGVFIFENDEGEVTHTAPLVVDTVDEPSYFSFRWTHPDGSVPVAGNSTLVEFFLETVGSDRTRLRLVESGLELLPLTDEERVSFAADHNGGWGKFSKGLVGLFAETSPG
jgi:uncharacterized protein YndB with AHSA1/START domain